MHLNKIVILSSSVFISHTFQTIHVYIVYTYRNIINQKGEKKVILPIVIPVNYKKKSINQTIEITKKSYSVHTYQRRKYILPSDIWLFRLMSYLLESKQEIHTKVVLVCFLWYPLRHIVKEQDTANHNVS